MTTTHTDDAATCASAIEPRVTQKFSTIGQLDARRATRLAKLTSMQHNGPLLQDLRRVLASPSPALLIEAASALAALSPEGTIGPNGGHMHTRQDLATVITQLAPVLVSNDDPETNAVLRVWAEMLGDDMLRRRVKHSVSRREHPAWLDALPETRVIRALGMGDVFREEETVMLEIQVHGHSFTLACAMIYLGGGLIEDGYLLPTTIAGACDDIPESAADTIVLREIPLPEAQRLIADALALSKITYPPFESDSWPLTQPALEWLLRIMPQFAEMPDLGPSDLARARSVQDDENEADLVRTTEAFAQSIEGRRLPQIILDEALLVFEYHQEYGSGDLLRWGPRFVEGLMMDIYPRKYLAPDQILLQLPRLLSAIVVWANRLSGISDADTQKVLRLIKKLTPEYRQIIKDGSASNLARFAMNANDGIDVADVRMPNFGLDDLPDDDFIESFINANPDLLAQFVRFRLEEEAGGAEELEELDTRPLAAARFDILLETHEVPADIRPRLHTIAALVTDIGGNFFEDPELVSVALLVLASSAAGDPAIYRRRASDEGTAAAACWVAGRNNRWFSAYDRPERSVQALTVAFGLRSTPHQRGLTMLRGMEVEEPLRTQDLNIGDSLYLTSTRRAAIIAERDALGEAGL